MKRTQLRLTTCLIRRMLKDRRTLKQRIAKRVAKRKASQLQQHKPTPREEFFPQTFIIESFFARELISALTRTRDEDMQFLTGPQIGPIRIVSRWARPVSLDEQSPVFVRASAKSVASVLIEIIEQGSALHCIAHSHPGCGPSATTPSGTDIECLGKLQKNGAQVIGMICSRDHHIRFFSVFTDFRVLVLGTGVKEVAKNVFHFASENNH